MRLFIAIEFNREFQRKAQKLFKFLEKKYWPVKWEPVEKLHFTLAFLGEVEEAKVKMVKEIVRKVSQTFSLFQLNIKGLGVFPDYLGPRIIWLGLKGDLKSLSSLKKRLEEELLKANFKIDKKPFVPHITLGRIKRAKFRQRREIGRQLKGMQMLKLSGSWSVDKIILFESKTLTTGSIYRQIGSYPLGK